MDKQTAYAHGRGEFEKASKIAFFSALLFYLFSDLPLLHVKFVLFIFFELIISGVILAPVYLTIPYYRSKVSEDSFNKTMAVLFLPLIGLSIGVGYLTVYLFNTLVA